jgi:hypothetical protein
MHLMQSLTLVLLLAPPASSPTCTQATHGSWLSGCYMLIGASTPTDDSTDSDEAGSPARKGFWTEGDLVAEFEQSCLSALEDRDSPAFEAWANEWLSRVQLCPWPDHVEWLRACYADLESLAGLTRSELLTKFKPAGYISPFSKTFYHNSCDALYIDVKFAVDDPSSAHGYLRDIVVSVQPYIGVFWQ